MPPNEASVTILVRHPGIFSGLFNISLEKARKISKRESTLLCMSCRRQAHLAHVRSYRYPRTKPFSQLVISPYPPAQHKHCFLALSKLTSVVCLT